MLNRIVCTAALLIITTLPLRAFGSIPEFKPMQAPQPSFEAAAIKPTPPDFQARYYTMIGAHQFQAKGFTPWSIIFLIAGFFLLFILYQYGLVSAAYRHDMPLRGIYRISIFYVRICGVFWIVFEWVVALFGIKTYKMMTLWGD